MACFAIRKYILTPAFKLRYFEQIHKRISVALPFCKRYISNRQKKRGIRMKKAEIEYKIKDLKLDYVRLQNDLSEETCLHLKSKSRRSRQS
jgi:capsule polysaccharide modification protein KpsS